MIFFLVLENFLLNHAHALIEYHDKLPIGVFELATELNIHVARDESPRDQHKPQCPVCRIETYDYAAVARTRLDIVWDTLIQDCHHKNEYVDNWFSEESEQINIHQGLLVSNGLATVDLF